MAGMTKADRAEYKTRLASVGYWRKLSHENALNYGLTSKREFLADERAKEAQALAELNEGERAYAVECLANGATFADAIQAAKEAAQRLEQSDKEETEKGFYTFNWRKEEGGDFYLQSFEGKNLSVALNRW